ALLLEESHRAAPPETPQQRTTEIARAEAAQLSGPLTERLAIARSHAGIWRRRLTRASTLIHPTTHEVVSVRAAAARRQGSAAVHCIEVPTHFSGSLQGPLAGRAVPSTKGRALNWGIRHTSPQADVWGFYDAESHPDRAMLLHVAWRHIHHQGPLLLQGPVFQVRNWYRMGPVSAIAALYQAAAHEWYLPVLMERLPFIGGTNFFAAPSLVRRVGGFDSNCLTEDLEFGVRCYLETGVWPQYLPVAATEQTPTAWLALFRQRLRWAAGYLDVFERVVQRQEGGRTPNRGGSPGRTETGRLTAAAADRIQNTLWRNGPVVWTFYQALILALLALWGGTAVGWLSYRLEPRWLEAVPALFAGVYITFTIYCRYRYGRYMDRSVTRIGRVLGNLRLLALPLTAPLLPLPYTTAMLRRFLGTAPQAWTKTPRTPETASAPPARQAAGD
ncbi:MAG: glycosyltransferase family 2 protein, partial [Thermaerobacterales bacterium]